MEIIQTTEAFKALVQDIKTSINGYKEPLAFGVCRVDMGQLNLEKTLQATYPVINWNENFGSAAIFIKALQEQGVEIDFTQSEVICNINKAFLKSCLNAFSPYSEEAYGDAHKNIQVISALYNQIATSGSKDGEFKVTFIFADEPLKSVEATYLKLYALSQAKVEIRSINLNGAFGALPNVAWSNGKPLELDYLREFEIELKLANEYPHIEFVDKFPRFLQHIIPADNTRILDTSKVRFGAQLAAGTTVMPGASYVNFNAGTTGAVMVEGRISSSAVVGAGSDIGGGASILGVLSGTDGNPITIGKNTLLGANSTCGIPLGDGCIIDGGLAVFAGTKFHINDAELIELKKVNPNTKFDNYMKGWELAGLHGLHFRQNSLNGQYVVQRSTREIKLNTDLH
ncbi:tetrahydrodipicolinate N-succinyltransferase N-terminal domain-containing protein [Sulfurimonas denitrificans]|uniref:2,3,4,5-tetrahydropyridine-2,6-dicarboxylate N-succinyltransferase n=1 Tax=Sulfurimonas denitrificans (strain ATCC 33889 / DSM 1251) TaxID=326298 RepID=DAPD_SULDN|nr:tetrahydrodipicolinate N-succinyltransferase N-terminal domain-containing protein [Sulfurimonas denitrificans]Q30RL0.2 RecName: Full=2,3,4,5-tetrahydropyridine-2,6-dicarboxylate N-succinyltransferase; AltName: Full=Tetrahydrodipicolinate N-succinyltransferase; Short=THDP succinyltransferase; Short=THP succinyltransferase; AltName: Full=Tetrahydropicolinate succinylase [Sulfurimonas denitrificans DSM 1251]MDD3441933.1 tetrahydrodipicolinate N-succinyltransferase N-terminal domain-containing pro